MKKKGKRFAARRHFFPSDVAERVIISLGVQKKPQPFPLSLSHIRTVMILNFVFFYLVPPLFLEKSVHMSVRKGDKANLMCEAKGDEPMDIFWKRNGIAILQEEDAR